ncbi:MAG TPA: YkgJ family cysteine cluster protein [Candidatus Brocadiia bacterium]|nr:YkgJ family cysteine cluster protein [Candidatus Brocadiia bacterium]
MGLECPAECEAKCCRYVTVHIESPAKNKVNRDEARWFLLHKGLSLLREKKQWYLQIDTACKALTADHRCGVYDTRPSVCRDYAHEGCDYHGEPNEKTLLIRTPEEWEAYLRRRAKKREKRRGRK